MKKVNAPCKDCESRFLGCHSTCERYNDFKKYREELNEQRHQVLHELNKPYIVRSNNPWRT